MRPRGRALNGAKNEGVDLLATTNSPSCCAERRLLADLHREACKHGVARHRTAAWMVRPRSDGLLGCSVPCVVCRAQLVRHGLRGLCRTGAHQWFHGRLTDSGAPRSGPTGGQVRWGGGGELEGGGGGGGNTLKLRGGGGGIT